MAITITKTGITFPGLRIGVTTDDQGALHYWLTVGYQVQMDDGETISRDHRTELIGTAATWAANGINTVTTILKTKEGLV